jgi:two-component system response regulator DegU
MQNICEVILHEVNIATIDRSELFRAGVSQRLSYRQGFKLLECSPDDDPLKFIDANSVDVALLDIDSPMSKGLELGRTIVRNYPNTKVIILSSFFNDEELFETLKIGAVAYLDKRIGIEELAHMITRAAKGEYPINDSVMANPKIAKRVLKQFQEIASMGLVKSKVAAPLTDRELQILRCIGNGSSNKQVALTLGISEQTIKNHVSAILRKLNANDRAHAVALAVSNQWISVEVLR